MKRKRIGITGGIGSGKSEVTKYLREKGYTVIDADEIARDAARPGEPAMLRFREEVGDDFFQADGELDRKALANLMFYDPIVLMTVNEIFHGDIQERIEKAARVCEQGGDAIVFLSAPLLFESEADWKTDEIWLVTANDDIRLRRTMDRDGLSEADVKARMQNQMPEDEKRKRADFILENNGTLAQLYASVDQLLNGNL